MENYEQADYWSVFGMVFNFCTCCCLMAMAAYHLWINLTNCIMFEIAGSGFENIFDFGARENLRNLFGKDVRRYFFPVECDKVECHPIRVTDRRGESKVFRNAAIVPYEVRIFND